MGARERESVCEWERMRESVCGGESVSGRERVCEYERERESV